MIRCHAEASDWSDERVLLPEEESHHLLHVLRVRPGQVVTVFDGDTRVVEARVGVLPAGERRLPLHPTGPAAGVPPPPTVPVDLVLALPREQKLDWILQKSTELQAAAIHPVFTRNALVRIDARKERGKRARWERIILNAAKQSGNLRPPVLHSPTGWEDWIARCAPYDLMLLGSLAPCAKPFRDVIPLARPRRVALLIGPEGDFTEDEREAARRAGARDVTFGPVVLRTETAALFGLSILRYVWD